MAKVFGPALSIDAKGKVGKGVAFQNRPRGIALIKNPVPSRKSLDDPSAKKQIQRNLVKQWISQWQAFSDNERAYWDYLAERSGLNIKGYHYWMKKKAALAFTVSHLRDYWPDMLEGLVGYWAFDSDGENVAKDLSGKGNDGILKPSYPDNCPLWVNSKNYMLGKALSFDGVDDYVDLPETVVNNMAAGTIEMWIYPNTIDAWRTFFAKQHNGVNSYVVFKYTTGNKLFFQVSNGHSVTTVDTYSAKQWYHVVARWDGSTIKIFVNGAEAASINDGAGVPDDTATLTGIGAWLGDGNQWFNGKIDDVRIYNRALTSAEISEHYNLLK